MDTLQSHYEEFIGVSEESRPSKRRRTEGESDSDSDDCEVVTTAHVKRSKKNWKKVLRSLAASESTTTSWGPTGNGANIALCDDHGDKVHIHETIVRDYTKIFRGNLLSLDLDNLKDPYGKLVVVMAGYDNQTITGLAELLYTGQTNVTSETAKTELLGLLEDNLVGCSDNPTFSSNDWIQEFSEANDNTLVKNSKPLEEGSPTVDLSDDSLSAMELDTDTNQLDADSDAGNLDVNPTSPVSNQSSHSICQDVPAKEEELEIMENSNCQETNIVETPSNNAVKTEIEQAVVASFLGVNAKEMVLEDLENSLQRESRCAQVFYVLCALLRVRAR